MQYCFGGCSDVGKREYNQDSVFIKQMQKGELKMLLGVVCDGVGTFETGGMAAAMSVCMLKEWFDNNADYFTFSKNISDIKEMLVEKLLSINEWISGYAKKNNIKTGTTLSAIFILNSNYCIVHIGDSRIYRISKLNGDIYQITNDDSLESMMLQKGLPFDERKKHIITQCIGAKANISIFSDEGAIMQEDVFLLCTDGFYGSMDKQKIFRQVVKINAGTNVEKVSKSLVKSIKKGNFSDNLSVGIIKAL